MGINPIDSLVAAQLSQAAEAATPPSLLPNPDAIPDGWTYDGALSQYSPPKGVVPSLGSFLVFYNDSTHQVAIVFGSTQNYADLASDVLTAGNRVWIAIQAQANEALASIQAKYPDSNVFTDGYGLGGGLAQTFALQNGLSGFAQNSLPISPSAVSSLAAQGKTVAGYTGIFKDVYVQDDPVEANMRGTLADIAAGLTGATLPPSHDPSVTSVVGAAYLDSQPSVLKSPVSDVQKGAAKLFNLLGSHVGEPALLKLAGVVGKAIAAYDAYENHSLQTLITQEKADAWLSTAPALPTLTTGQNDTSLAQDTTSAVAADALHQAGYYIANSGDTADSIAAALSPSVVFNSAYDGATLTRINAVFGVDLSATTLQTGALVHVPVSAVSSALFGTLTPAPAGQVLVIDPTSSNHFYYVGASLDSHDSGALIIDTPDATGHFLTLATGTYSNVGFQSDGTIDIALVDGGLPLGILTLSATGIPTSLKLTDQEVIDLSGSAASQLTAITDTAAIPEATLDHYLAQLGASVATSQQLDTLHDASLSKLPATQTITFGNGQTLTLDRGSYSSASHSLLAGTYTINLTTASGASIGTLELNANTAAGSMTLLDGSTIEISGITAPTTLSAGNGSPPLDVIENDLAQLGSPLSTSQLSALHFDTAHPAAQPYTYQGSFSYNGTGYSYPLGHEYLFNSNQDGPIAPGAIMTGLTTYTLPDGTTETVTNNIIEPGPGTNDLTRDTISGVQELILSIYSTTIVTRAEYDAFQTIYPTSSRADVLTLADGGTYSQTDSQFHGRYAGFTADSWTGTTLIGATDATLTTFTASLYGNDTLMAGGGFGNVLIAGGGNDKLIAGDGQNEVLIAGTGIESLTGGTGGDLFIVNATLASPFIGGSAGGTGGTPAAGSVLEGAGANNILVATGDISELAISGIQTLNTATNVSWSLDSVFGSPSTGSNNFVFGGGGSIELTAAQFDGFQTIVGGGTIVAATSGEFSLVGKTTDSYNLTATDWGTTTLIGNDANGETLTASLFGNDTLQAGNGAGATLVAGEGVDKLIGGTGGDTFVAADGLAYGSEVQGYGTNDVLQASGDITGATITGIQTLQTNDITLTASQFAAFNAIQGSYGTIFAGTGGTFDLSSKTSDFFDLTAETNAGTKLIANDNAGEVLTASALGNDNLITGSGAYYTLDASGTGGNNTLDASHAVAGSNGAGFGSDLDVSDSTGDNSLKAGTGQGYKLDASGSSGNNNLDVTNTSGYDRLDVSNSDGDNKLITGDGDHETLDASSSFGNNTLTAGNGNYDVLNAADSVGDNVLKAGDGNGDTLSVGNAAMMALPTMAGSPSFGDNTLTVGNGAGDILTAVGSYGNNSLTAGDGSGDTLNASYSSGDNTLTAGNGDGDVLDVNYSTGNNILRAGNGQNDVLNATGATGSNTFIVGAGSSTIYGGAGDNTYIVSGAATENVTIINDDTGTNHTIIRFVTGVSASDVTLAQSGTDLVITEGTDPITVQNYFGSATNQIDAIQFADGTMWDPTIIAARTPLVVNGSVSLTAAQFNSYITIEGSGTIFGTTGGTYDLSGKSSASINLTAQSSDGTTLIGDSADGEVLTASTSGADTLTAGNGAGDVLNAGAGLDILNGGNGGDTFNIGMYGTPAAGSQFHGGTGIDTLSANGDLTGYTITGIETLQTNYATLTGDQFNGFTSFAGNGYLLLTLTTGGTWSLVGKTISGTYGYALQTTSSTDTTLIANDADNVQLNATQSSGNDTLIGGNGQNQTLMAGSGNDTLIAGDGGDYLVLGSGVDIARGGAGDDGFEVDGTAVPGTSIDGGGGTNTLFANGDISQLTYTNIQTLGVTSATSLTASQLAGFTSIESVYGSFPPGFPAPTALITAVTGGTYSLAGRSTDLINMTAASNSGTILIGNDANGEVLTASLSGNDTLHGGNGNNDKLMARSTSGNDTLIAGNGLNGLLDASHSTGTVTMTGGNGGDYFSSGQGFTTMNGGNGSDYFLIGHGNAAITGGNGNNTYDFTYASTAGNYIINDFHTDGSHSNIVFGTGITSSSLHFSQSGSDLAIAIGNESITVQNWFAGSAYQVASVKFADGTNLTAQQINALLKPTLSWSVAGLSSGAGGPVTSVQGTTQSGNTVNFYDGASLISSVVVSAADGTFTANLPSFTAGEHSITAVATSATGGVSDKTAASLIEVGTAGGIASQLDALAAKTGLAAIWLTDTHVLPEPSSSIIAQVIASDQAALSKIVDGYSFAVTTVTSTTTKVVNYDANGHLTSTVTTTYKSGVISSVVTVLANGTTDTATYSNGIIASEVIKYASGSPDLSDTRSFTAGVLTRDTVVHADGSKDVYIYQNQNQSYVAEHDAYNPAGVLIAVTRTHADGSLAYTYVLDASGNRTTDLDDASGALKSHTVLYADGSSHVWNYTNGVLVSDVLKYALGAPDISDSKSYTTGVLSSETVVHADHSKDVYQTNIAGKTYVAEHDVYDASGVLLSVIRTKADSSTDYSYSLAADGTKTADQYDTSDLLKSHSVVHADGSSQVWNYVNGVIASEVLKYAAGAPDISDTKNFTAGVLANETIVHADHSKDVWYYGITGKTYVAEHDSYNAAGVLISIVRTKADGSVDYTYSLATDGTKTTDQYDAADLLKMQSIVHADGSSDTWSYVNGVITSEVVKYAAGAPDISDSKNYTSGILTSETTVHADHSKDVYQTNIAGKTYVAEHDVYNAAGTLTGVVRSHADGSIDYTYNLAADGTKTTDQYDASSNLKTQSVVHTDGSSETTNYANGSLTSDVIKYAAGAPDISDSKTYTAGLLTNETIVHADHSKDVYLSNITGKTYVTEHDGYNSLGTLDLVFRFHADGTEDYDYNLAPDGTKTTNQYDAAGTLTSHSVVDTDGSSDSFSYVAGVLTRETVVHTDHSKDVYQSNITGKTYTAEHDAYNSAGTLVSIDRTQTDGSHQQTAYVANAELTSTSGVADFFTSSSAGGDTFVFKPGSGTDTVTHFHAGSGSNADILELAGQGAFQDFATWATTHLHQAAGSADTIVDESPTDHITLKGISLASLTAANFHLIT
ncbi:beta strand repeat-containing protein [Bradyrhizobium iriomotense]|uniref:Haemolysin-type calcium binding-related domain-containing protein n=1 Tax=Bradyrhizobium iriomotense TaxID=441950 RepID=A0ABQ6AZ94_9BRAD|nr:calcium-binding protein [Bradyrhizobium iriomotense]GLR86521.1 hypothetical protein GCM10007857_32320 [Bradyrhizobium iriomotense]